MNSDVRQQIIVSLRAEGDDQGAKIRESLTSIDVGLHKLQLAGIKFADQHEKAMARAADATEALAIKDAEAFAKIAENHEKFLEREAAAAEAVALREAEAFAKAAERHEAFLASEVTAAERAAKAADMAAIRKVKAIQDAERAQQEASAKVNAALAADAAAVQKDVQTQLDATNEIERLKQRETAAYVSAQIDRQRTSAANAKAAMLNAREQQHLNDILREGAEMERTATKTTVAVASAHGQASSKTSQYGYAILHLSHAFQDLQYGAESAINNIPLIVSSMGGSAGVAGAAMAAAVGIQLVNNHMEEFKSILGMTEEPVKAFTGTIEGLQQHIKEIEDHPIKFGADTMEIDEAKQKVKELQAAEEALRAAREGKTVFEKQAGEEVAQTFAAEGAHAGEAMSKVQAQYVQELFATSEGLKKQQKIIRDESAKLEKVQDLLSKGGDVFEVVALANQAATIKGTIDTAITRAGNLRGDLIKEAAGKAGGLLAGAKAGNRPEDREELARRLRAAGEKSLANSVELSNPEEVEKLSDVESRFDIGVEGIKSKYKTARKREADAKNQTATAARNREQLVNQEATRYGTLAQAKGPGSLTDAIVRHVQQGQSNAQITAGLRGQVKSRIKEDVPEGLIDDVANQILDKAIGKVRAEVAAMGGADAVASDRGEKFNRAQTTAGNRRGRQQSAAMERAMAEDIFAETGGQFGSLGEQGSLTAAHRAIQSMKRGINMQPAMLEATLYGMAQLGALNEQMMAELMRLQEQINGLSRKTEQHAAQIRRGQAQRGSVYPHFGGG